MSKLLTELIDQAQICLKDLGMSEGTIRTYRHSAFHPVEIRFGENEYVDSSSILLQEKFFWELYHKGEISRKTLNWRIRGIRILAEICETGTFKWKVFSKKEKQELPAHFSSILQSFLSTKKCSKKRKRCMESICFRFLITIVEKNIKSFDGITSEDVRSFMIDISKTRSKSMDDVVYTLRSFFQYLCENGLYHNNFWMLLAAPHCRDHHVLASVTPEEISMLINAIDVDTINGKRDFAVLSLAVVSGLRAGDLASLKLRDIDWKKNEIRLIQGKTTEQLVLPISKHVLQAVADYILNGRPETSSDCVFVRHLAPFEGYHDGVSIACIFRKYQKKAGLPHETGDGKTLHGLRRGLGTQMTVCGIPVETVAQVLGHRDIKATKQYISADMLGMQKCVLDSDSLGGADNNEPF